MCTIMVTVIPMTHVHKQPNTQHSALCSSSCAIGLHVAHCAWLARGTLRLHAVHCAWLARGTLQSACTWHSALSLYAAHCACTRYTAIGLHAAHCNRLARGTLHLCVVHCACTRHTAFTCGTLRLHVAHCHWLACGTLGCADRHDRGELSGRCRECSAGVAEGAGIPAAGRQRAAAHDGGAGGLARGSVARGVGACTVAHGGGPGGLGMCAVAHMVVTLVERVCDSQACEAYKACGHWHVFGSTQWRCQ